MEQTSRALRCDERSGTEQHHPRTLSSKRSDPLSLEVKLKRSGSALGMAWPVSGGITVGAGSDDVTDDGSVSVVLVTGATMEDTGTRNSGSVGCPVNSLKVAPRLLETRVSVTSTKEL